MNTTSSCLSPKVRFLSSPPLLRNFYSEIYSKKIKSKNIQKITCQVSTTEDHHALICSSITADNLQEALSQINTGTDLKCDILEFRLDYLSEGYIEALKELQSACKLPYIVTMRPIWEGGNYQGDEEQRLEVQLEAMKSGAPYVDIELNALEMFRKVMHNADFDKEQSNTKLIVSYHNFNSTPERSDVLALLLAIAGNPECDIVKAAFMANDVSDAVMLLEVMQEMKEIYGITKPIILLSMGERGQPARILAGKYGGFLTFGAMGSGFESAPGQPTVSQLRDLYRVQAQNKDTKVYGIVANPVSHSKSPLLHNTSMKELGFNGVYIPLLVDNMQKFLAAYSDPSFAGFSVSIPHKQDALRLSDEKEPVAQKIGAANTLIRQADGSLKSYNTDWSAAIDAIARGMEEATGSDDLTGKTVVVIGAGGAGRGLVFGAMTRGAKVILSNRSYLRAENLLKETGQLVTFVPLEKLCEGTIGGDVLANSTSVGMHPNEDESPVPAKVTKNFQVVFDAVYNPLETKLLEDASANGCVCVSGVEMFVGQAAQQFELFTGMEPPVELMSEVVLESLSS